MYILQDFIDSYYCIDILVIKNGTLHQHKHSYGYWYMLGDYRLIKPLTVKFYYDVIHTKGMTFYHIENEKWVDWVTYLSKKLYKEVENAVGR